MTTEAKVWLITGSSTGFGRSLAEAVFKYGDRVIATARKPEQLDDLVAQHPDTVKAIRLDVTNSQKVRDAVVAAIARSSRTQHGSVSRNRWQVSAIPQPD